jgi:hypothetical protein
MSAFTIKVQPRFQIWPRKLIQMSCDYFLSLQKSFSKYDIYDFFIYAFFSINIPGGYVLATEQSSLSFSFCRLKDKTVLFLTPCLIATRREA